MGRAGFAPAGFSGFRFSGYGTIMGDTDIRFYLSILVRRLPLLVAIAALLTGLGLAAAYLMPPVYRASARILVEPPQIPAELARPTVQVNPVEQLQIIEQDVTTRENLLELATRLDIYGSRHDQLSEADIVENLRARTTLEQVETRRGGEGAIVFSVSFSAREPELAANVVNELVAIILGKNIDLRTGKAEDTVQFFEREVARLGAELSAREDDVLRFRNANKGALPDSIDFRRTQQSNQQERLLLLEREESALRVRRNNLVRMFEATGQIAGTGPLSPEQEMLRDMKRALAERLSVFAEDSPGVASLKGRIATLQQEVQASAGAADAAGGPSELDLQLLDMDERLGFIEREKTAIASYLEDLGRSIDATPQNETRLNALERDRDNIRSQYNNAVARFAEASTGEQIEMRAKAGRFSVVEPATPPQNRISPNRRHIAGGGLAAGIMLGLGVIVLLELANRSIRRPGELALMLQAPPLATIPYIWREGEKRTRDRRIAAGFAAAASLAALLAIGVQHYRTPLAAAFENLVVSIDSNRLM